MAWRFQKMGRTGWYYRVLSIVTVKTGDVIALKHSPNPTWTVVARVTAARLTRKVSTIDAAQLASLPELAEGWRCVSTSSSPSSPEKAAS
jgi:MOSC domain-containing protein YiiM